MKKLIIVTIFVLSLFTFTPVLAQDDGQRSVDNETIEESLREEGLDEAPGVVEVPEIEMQGQQPSSGFVDDNGDPISIEDYNKIREDEKKTVRTRQIILGVGLVVVIAATVVTVVLVKKKKK